MTKLTPTERTFIVEALASISGTSYHPEAVKMAESLIVKVREG